jgi:manganese/iron transport system substrate-binding protein
LTNLVKEIHQKNISVIFTDTNTNPNLLEPLAREAKVKIFPRPLYVSGLGVAGSDAETYQKMMDNNTRNIVEGLGGTYLQFQPSP